MMQVASYDFDQFETKNLAKPFPNETLVSIFKATLGNSSVECSLPRYYGRFKRRFSMKDL